MQFVFGSTAGEDERKLHKETRYYCDAALCPAPCFQLFHTNLISDTEIFHNNNYDITYFTGNHSAEPQAFTCTAFSSGALLPK